MVFLERLLGLPDVRVADYIEHETHIVLQLRMKTTEGSCPHCGCSTRRVNQTRTILIRDLPISGQVVYLQVPRRQFHCSNCSQYFTEPLSFADRERNYTRRYEEHIYQQVKQRSIEEVSAENDISTDRVRGIFEHVFGKEQVKKKAEGFRSRKISIDEISMRKGYKQYVTVISDLENHCLLEVIDSHKAEEIIEVVKSLWTEEERLSVEEVSIDMWAGFGKVIREVFPNAKIVYDRFHVMQKAIKELDKIRRQSGITESGARRVILKNSQDLNEEEKIKLNQCLSQSKRVRKAYEMKEGLRDIFERRSTVEEGKSQMVKWLEKAQSIYTGVVKTIKNHLEGICQYFENRITSGIMEGINNRIKVIKRQGYGFTNVANFRARLLAAFWP